ncbi:BACON domain-containing protein [Dysgonomonas sp. Marseille-P4677]|uniref:BACON domain-containing protein n=1 Tax=Dysgonomonas sp. Marseille-P4677 TaxID=2364790 RepID=UPI001911C56F|nr:BACON domain-containing protein [Dysgonomonas sp. Marseille-P4677]MBK5721873.1 BACON domain-containing protein [Dysgonomonas sp. Marseille-P4677]
MRNILVFSLILSLILACSKDEEKEITLTTSVQELFYTADEGEKSFRIQSNHEWTINNIPDWCTLDITEGSGDQHITVKALANPNESDRKSELTIKAGSKTISLKITQLAKNVTLAISEFQLTFAAEGDEKSIQVITNEAWTVTDAPEWIIPDIGTETDSGILKLKIEENLDEAPREAILTIKAGSKSEQLTIKQSGLVYTLNISYGVINFFSKDDPKAITITSNGKWTVSPEATWCVPDKQEGIKDQTLAVSVLENLSDKKRETEIIIKAGKLTKKVYIKQGRFITVTDNPYQFNERDNAIRTGDKLIGRQIEHVDPGSKGENIVWNFSNLKVTNSAYTVEYSDPPFETGTNEYILGRTRFKLASTEPNSLVVRTEHNTMYSFHTKDNQILAYGHENPSVILEYNPRMIFGKFPTYYGDSYKYDYKSKGLYSGSVGIATKGYMEMEADAYGSVIFPTGKIDNVIRIRYTQLIQDDYLPGSQPSELPPNKSLYTIYRWYAKGYRYPIFEVMKSENLNENKTIFETAFYYPPEVHTYLNKGTKSMPIRILDNKEIIKRLEKCVFKP